MQRRDGHYVRWVFLVERWTMKLHGEFFSLHLNARREGDQLVSVASFRTDGHRREYQVEARLSVGGSWYHDALRVNLPEIWGDAATRVGSPKR